ncbi:hypothetical protein SAMN05444424_0264 [Bittarella massiliensis (ex Durand et al. 2017)]|uniref:Uncharacterized protein n=1 Tax=Bittarella massiliensis (ex Durand et al. 2017) TaxID=1720313 RepID=A0AAQ1MBI2_9FIRM|nr:hypothetical protein SAMN05444424_0264 [Bittarella massiliensis (ex Durand et al. 2017)]
MFPREGGPRGASASVNPRSISIHVPARGATATASSLASPRQSFNLQRLHGVRPLPTKPPSLYQSISIHAPAGGATRRGFSTRRAAAAFGSALSSTPSARPLSPVRAPARKEGPGQIAPGPLETVGPAYFTILATSEARSSSLFSMPSPFSKRANLTMEMLPPSSFATWAVYLATVRSWSLTKGCSSRQTSL